MAKEPETVAYEVADKSGKTVATGKPGEKQVVIPKLTPNTDYAKGDFKGRKVDPADEWQPSDYIDIPAFKIKPISVTGVNLNNTTLSLETGKTATLKATVKPDNATNKGVNWASDNEDVATVDNKGGVTAVKAGTANIKVGTKDGNKSAQCKVTVKNPVVNVTGVSLDKTELSVEEGATAQLKATVTPNNATDKTVTWKSGNPETFAIDNNGKVTGVKAGQATAVVTTKNGSKTAECKVTVTAKPEPDPEEPTDGE